MYEELNKLNQERAQREESAAKSLVNQILGSGDMNRATAIAQQTLNTFSTQETRRYNSEREAQCITDLGQAGISVTMQHYDGDNSYPVEYCIQHGDTRAIGPAFEIALVLFAIKVTR